MIWQRPWSRSCFTEVANVSFDLNIVFCALNGFCLGISAGCFFWLVHWLAILTYCLSVQSLFGFVMGLVFCV